MAIITKSTQTAAQKLQAVIDANLQGILQPAIDEATEPLKKEMEAHRVLVNETVEKARKDNETAKKMLSDKENELIGAKTRISEIETTLARTTQILSERDNEIATLKKQIKERDTEISALKAQIADLTKPKPAPHV